MLLDGTFKIEEFREFLRRLIKHKRKKIYLIIEGYPAHKMKQIKKWLEENMARSAAYFLPMYSPQPNPDE